MIIVDAQVHVWERETADRPWPPRGRAKAQGAEFTGSDLLAEMTKIGVDRAVLVPPSWEGDYNGYCLGLASAHPDRFRVMGRLDLAAPASRSQLASWRGQPGMLGVRVSFGEPSMIAWLHDGTASWFWREAETWSVPVMIWAPLQVDVIGAIARAHPGLPLLVDHLALREGLDADAIGSVIEQVVGLASFGNVAVKATGLPGYAPEGYPFPSLHEPIRRVVDAFGPKRVFWGSDLTRMRCSYAEVKDLFTKNLDFLSAEDLDWIMGRGICAWLGWELRESLGREPGDLH